MSTSSDLIEARALAEAVLQAAGTSLRNYDLNGSQARILAAAEAERLAAEQRGADRQREADGWRDIETDPPPKDGNLVLLALSPHPGFRECPRKVGGWWDQRWNIFGASWEPTHWQPLPQPPRNTKG